MYRKTEIEPVNKRQKVETAKNSEYLKEDFFIRFSKIIFANRQFKKLTVNRHNINKVV